MAETPARKVAFVTGAGSGIGRATAEAFITAGYATALVDFNEAAGRQVEAELRKLGECSFIAGDVADDASVKRAVEQAVATYGRLDAAFNGAGINGEGAQLADGTMENWQRVIAVDLTGVWSCMRYQIPEMLKNGGGAIVNAGSTAGLVGAPFLAPYVAAKHGVLGLTKAAAIDYARQGIRVNAVCPGMTDTPMMQNGVSPELLEVLLQECPMGRLGKPQEIAATVVWLCSEGASYITGQGIPVDGAWTSR